MLIILSGCSGAGKNTVINALMEQNKNIDIFTSITTRPMRETETQGNPFFYFTKEEFENKDKQGLIIEKEFIHGNYYGTSYEVLEEKLALNKILIKDIGVEGTLNLQQILKEKLNILTIFLDVPKKELIKRITLRGEPKDRVKVRSARFDYELSFRKNYQYLFKQLPLENSVLAVKSIIEMHKNNSEIYSVKELNNKKVQKCIEKLKAGKKAPCVKMGFFNNKLCILNNAEWFVAGMKTDQFVQKIVLNKNVKHALSLKI